MRHLAWQNAHYFTLRTTFNQPGHLATVVAFDLPINDLIPPGMTIDSFRIEPDPSQNLATTPDKESADHIGITFNGMQIDIATDISTTGMQLLWTVPMSTMLLESMQNILLPLLLNIGLLALALFGFTTFRHYKGRSHSSGAGPPPPPTANCVCCAPLTKRLFLCCRWGCSFTIRKPTERLSAIQLPTICFRT